MILIALVRLYYPFHLFSFGRKLDLDKSQHLVAGVVKRSIAFEQLHKDVKALIRVRYATYGSVIGADIGGSNMVFVGTKEEDEVINNESKQTQLQED